MQQRFYPEFLRQKIDKAVTNGEQVSLAGEKPTKASDRASPATQESSRITIPLCLCDAQNKGCPFGAPASLSLSLSLSLSAILGSSVAACVTSYATVNEADTHKLLELLGHGAVFVTKLASNRETVENPTS